MRDHGRCHHVPGCHALPPPCDGTSPQPRGTSVPYRADYWERHRFGADGPLGTESPKEASPADHRSLPTTPAEGNSLAAARSRWAPLRPLVLRLHFYAGVLVAPLPADRRGRHRPAVRGLFQAEKLLYDHELTVPGRRPRAAGLRPGGSRPHGLHPEGTVTAVRPAPQAGATTRVPLSGVRGVDPGHTLAVFVDPRRPSRRVAPNSTARPALPLRTWIDELRDLHLGETGRLWRAGRQLAVGDSGRRPGAVVLPAPRPCRSAAPAAGAAPPRTARHGRRLDGRRVPVPVGDQPDLVGVRGRPHRRAAHLARPGHPVPSRRPWPAANTPGTARRQAPAARPKHGVGLGKVLAAARAKGLDDPVENGAARGPGRAYVVQADPAQLAEARTPSPSTRAPDRSSTSCGSPTTRCSPSSPAGASTCTPGCCSDWSSRSPSRCSRSPDRAHRVEATAP